jgi:hypothetical protein
MFDGLRKNLRAGAFRLGCWTGVGVLLLAAPAAVLAQAAGDPGLDRRFAVGGGFQIGSVACYECGDPGALGARGGFEVRLTDRLSVVTEGVWTAGYDVWGFEEGGVDYPGLRHDYFAFLEAKLRLEFSSMRHKPYMVVGGAARWDHDTFYEYGRTDAEGWWQWDVNDVAVLEQRDVRGAVVVGFGWAFKVGDRFEIRPEADLYIGRGSYASVGVTGWFNF